jgi:CubicO group peptidase (beta-lactamase class C family)
VARHRRDLPPIEGLATPAFEEVRLEFTRNFTELGELGAACAIYHRGEKVVDLWGGYRSAATRAPWTQQTLVLVFSVTKGVAATVIALAHSRGLLELNQPVATYWPEFAQAGKAEITVRQLLAHQAGLISVDVPLTPEQIGSHDRMAELLARQRPAWPPGTRHGYHALTLGWYQNELIRRVDPQHRSLGTFFQQEIARPLGLEFFIGLPPDIPDERRATIAGFHRSALLRHLDTLPIGMVLSGLWPQSLAARSVKFLRIVNPAQLDRPAYRHVEIPSANGFGTARSLARLYGLLAAGGGELGIAPRTFAALTAPPRPPTRGTRDAIMKIDTAYSCGFSRPSPAMQFGTSSSAFGCPGAGGSFAMADPDAQLGFAYVTNQMGFHLFDDPREKALRDACYRSLATLRDGSRSMLHAAP